MVAFIAILTTYYYNISHTPAYTTNSGGFFYTTALKQLLIGLYVMEGSVFTLMLLVTDADGKPSCAGQAIIVLITGICTAVFDYLLRKTFGSLIIYLPAVLKEQHSEENGSSQSDEAGGNNESEVGEAREENPEAMFSPPILTSTHPLVRIPRDDFGFSKEEIIRARGYNGKINITDEQADIDPKGRIYLKRKV